MTMTQAQLLQFCRDYECETLSEVLLAVAESSRHCTSEGGGRIPTWPLKEAASRLSEMDAEIKRLEKERAYAVRWGEGAVESVKEVMWRYEDALKQINMHLSNHIETHKKVDVAVALAFETARAALEHQQQQKGEKL